MRSAIETYRFDWWATIGPLAGVVIRISILQYFSSRFLNACWFLRLAIPFHWTSDIWIWKYITSRNEWRPVSVPWRWIYFRNWQIPISHINSFVFVINIACRWVSYLISITVSNNHCVVIVFCTHSYKLFDKGILEINQKIKTWISVDVYFVCIVALFALIIGAWLPLAAYHRWIESFKLLHQIANTQNGDHSGYVKTSC